MLDISDWQYDEYRQVGKDYGDPDEVALYDQTHAQFRNLRAENDSLLDALALTPGDALMDIGCGTGTFAIQAAARRLQVTAIDISDAMLAHARQRAQAEGVASIAFEKAGFLTVAEGTGPFDGIATSFALHHLPDFWKWVALKRMHGLLKPAGRLLVQDVIIDDTACMENISSFIEEQYRLGGEFLGLDAVEHFRCEFSTFDWILTSLLERAGFHIDSHRSEKGVVSRYLCTRK